MTGTEVLATGAFPVAVSLVVDTNVVLSGLPSNETTEPATNPVPVTVRLKLPVLSVDGVSAVILGAARMVTEAAPLAVGTATLVARIVTTLGLGTVEGGRYCPLESMVPTTTSPPAVSFTLHVTPVDAPVTVALNV